MFALIDNVGWMLSYFLLASSTLAMHLSSKRLRRVHAMTREVMEGIIENQNQEINHLVDALNKMNGMTVSVPQAITKDAFDFQRAFQAGPIEPATVAATCRLVIDQMHASIPGVTDQDTVNTILACCTALDELCTIVEEDQAVSDAAAKILNQLE